jgi:hypothetical protein
MSDRAAANPYHFGSPVSGEQFCDREQELRTLRELMLNGANAILLSPRRYGKTSLLHRAIGSVRRRGGRSGYVSMLTCTTPREVTEALLTAVVNGPASAMVRATDSLARVLRRLPVTPSVTVDDHGHPALSFSRSSPDVDWREVMGRALTVLGDVAKHHPASLVLDEFQHVAEIDPGLAGVFKAVADDLSGVSLVFAGSRHHLMSELSGTPGAPLLGMGQRIALDVIPEPAMTRHLSARAAAAGRRLDGDVAALIYARAQAVPNDVQQLAFSAFALGGEEIGASTVEDGFSAVVSQQASVFAEQFLWFGGAQQRLLKALAHGAVVQVYSEDFRTTVDVRNTNAMRKALESLSRQEVLVRRDDGWTVANPFFAGWIREAARGGSAGIAAPRG